MGIIHHTMQETSGQLENSKDKDGTRFEIPDSDSDSKTKFSDSDSGSDSSTF